MKNVTELLTAIRSVSQPTKAASADPTKLPDPDEKGPATESSTASGTTEEIEPVVAGNLKEDPKTGPVTPKDVELQNNGGEESPSKLAGAAAFEAAQKIKSKIASQFTTAPAKAATADPVKLEDTNEKTNPETVVMKGEPEKVASAPAAGDAVYELVQAMVKSASGRVLISDAISELVGVEASRELVKRAAEQGEQAELDFLQKQAQQLEQLKIAAAVQEHQEQLEETFAELTKGASAEDHEKIANTAELIKAARSNFSDNPEADAYFVSGIKVAAAVMAGGAEDPAAMEAAMTEEMAAPEGEPGIEEIIAALEELVASGQIDAATAEQIAMALAGGGEGAEAAPAPGAEEMPKAASANSEILSRLEVINTIAENVTGE